MMAETTGARIFISYSRKDGSEFARDLRTKLLQQQFSVWQDLIALEGGRDWWTQIDEALKSRVLQHFILVVTPSALASPVVRREIRLARQEAKTFCPIKGPGLGDLGKLPRWLGQLYDLDLSEHRTTLVRVLQDQSRQKRVVMMAPEPPQDFVQRPAEFERLKRQLLDTKGDAVAITAALRGAGGYGKTTLARALAHDADIQDAYFDGILWVELGEKPENLLSIISDLITRLKGEAQGLQTINGAASAFAEVLGDRRILIVVDDVWSALHLRPFLQGGTNTTRLITTRLGNVLPENAIRQAVDAMREDEAQEVLAGGLPLDQLGAQRPELDSLAAHLGKWALLLKLVNGFLRDRIAKKQTLKDAIAAANTRLDEKGLVAFDARNENDRTKAIALTIGVSLDLLNGTKRTRFGELGIFPEDSDIPVGIVACLWAEMADFGASGTEDFLNDLYSLSLLLDLNLAQRTFRLHDTIRHYLQNQAGNEGLVIQHKCLLTALDNKDKDQWSDAPTQRYYYLNLPHHLAAAGERERLDALLTDPDWLTAKLAATEDPQALVADYEQHAVGEAQALIGRTLRLTAGILARDQRQLIPQLLGRLMTCRGSEMSMFLDKLHWQLVPPAILVKSGSLIPPGAETDRFEANLNQVIALCVLPDGRLASAGSEVWIGLWDVKVGIELARLEGHRNYIHHLCVLPDGRLASGSDDGTIRLWDVKTGAETGRIEGCSVSALCALPDGRLASGCFGDDTIRLWDPTTCNETARLAGHSDSISALCVVPDGRLASGSHDKTIRLWNVKTGTETGRLEGHSDVWVMCVLPDGRLASGSFGDDTIRLWDPTTCNETACFEGHLDAIRALCVLPDGRLASGSHDKTIRLWNVKTGTETGRLEGHVSHVPALCMLPDGRLASGSHDDTIRLWNLTLAEAANPEGHSDWVKALCVLSDRQLASGSADTTIRLWDVKTGTETGRFKGHPVHGLLKLTDGQYSETVNALCALPDGRIASGLHDSTIRLWDVKTGTETTRLGRRSASVLESVLALAVLPDGRLASGSNDGTIRFWDLNTGTETACLEIAPAGGSPGIKALCVLLDGRLASGSYDGTIRLWNVNPWTETARFGGKMNWVFALTVLQGGWLASGLYDATIRLWDVKTGEETVRLEGHTDCVNALCVLPDGRLASGSRDKTIRYGIYPRDARSRASKSMPGS